jgi:hypothetical protein
MRVTVLAWRVRGIRVYPSLSRIQSLNLTLGEVTKGNGRVNERRRFKSAITGIRAGQEVDALK